MKNKKYKISIGELLIILQLYSISFVLVIIGFCIEFDSYIFILSLVLWGFVNLFIIFPKLFRIIKKHCIVI